MRFRNESEKTPNEINRSGIATANPTGNVTKIYFRFTKNIFPFPIFRSALTDASVAIAATCNQKVPRHLLLFVNCKKLEIESVYRRMGNWNIVVDCKLSWVQRLSLYTFVSFALNHSQFKVHLNACCQSHLVDNRSTNEGVCSVSVHCGRVCYCER